MDTLSQVNDTVNTCSYVLFFDACNSRKKQICLVGIPSCEKKGHGYATDHSRGIHSAKSPLGGITMLSNKRNNYTIINK